ncbi:T9SS type A sorting domain-containing protein, partial [Bacteroidota bacterium]
MSKKFFFAFLFILNCLLIDSQSLDWIWVKNIYGNLSDAEIYHSDVDIDNDGDIIILGEFIGTIKFGSIELNSQGLRDIFIAKCDTIGNWKWAFNIGGDYEDFGKTLEINNNNDVIVFGSYSHQSYFGDSLILAVGPDFNNSFLAKFNEQGEFMWVHNLGTRQEYEGDLAIDINDNIYITGSFGESIRFGETILKNNLFYGIYAAKCNSNGTWIWAEQANGNNPSCIATSEGICVDNIGNITITGYYNGDNLIFGSDTLDGPDGEGNEMYIAHSNSSGNWEWAIQGGGAHSEWPSCIEIDDSGSFIIAGIFDGTAIFGDYELEVTWDINMFLAKYTKDGLWEMATQSKGNSSVEPEDIDVIENIIYVTGSFYFDSATFGDAVLYSNGESDFFVAQCDNSGNWISANSAGGSQNDRGNSIVIDENNNLITVGTYKSEAVFGNLSLTTTNNSHFIGKLGSKSPDTYFNEQNESRSNPSLKIFPNPLSGKSIIEFRLANPSNVGIDFYTIDGKYIQNVFNGVKGTGVHNIMLDTENLSSGIYLLKIRTDEYNTIQKCV